MGSSVITATGDQNKPQGHCSRCGKIWTLETGQGVCRWCGKLSNSLATQTKPHPVKSRSNRGRKQISGNGSGYDHLEGEWLTYYKVGKGFEHRVKPEDREDFLHDLFLSFARVKASYTVKGKELTVGGLVRVARYEVADYWRKQFKRTKGIDCGRCSREQRDKCRDWDSYIYMDCPKAVKLEHLDQLIEDGDGNNTPLHEFIADDRAVDVSARLEARFTLDSYPRRFVQLAYKKYAGYPLTSTEKSYYYTQLKKVQKTLV